MKDTVMKILKYILLIAVTVLFLFPVIYMLACSFMTGSQVSEMLNFSPVALTMGEVAIGELGAVFLGMVLLTVLKSRVDFNKISKM